MNRYPIWKYLIILTALTIGLLYTLPNFFGETYAVQVSPAANSTAKVDASLVQTIEKILGSANIPHKGILMDATSVKVKFADSDTQLKGQEVLNTQLNPVTSDKSTPAYVVALNLLSNSPGWLASIGAHPMALGLDLRGGVHFLLQVDMRGALTKAIERYNGDIRNALREKKIPVSGISREGSNIKIRFKDEAARNQAMNEIQRLIPDLALKRQDTGTEFNITASLKPEAQTRTQDLALQQNINTLRNRVNELGVAEPIVQQEGGDRVVVQLPGVQDTARAKEILGRTATLEIRMVDEEHSDATSLQAAMQGRPPFGSELLMDRENRSVLVKKNIVLTGDRIKDARPGFDPQTGEPAVHITLDGAGARIFQRVTRENVGKRMAILLVEKNSAQVITAPVIRSEIGGGQVQISGHMTSTEARDVSLLMRAGALAAPMDIIEERTVGPSLGADNIEKGFKSTLYGFMAIAIFMIIYYHVFGVISIVALAVNVLFLIALLSMLPTTLTLPGIAGIALTVGMAIDANVLINERIREELRNGSTPQAAIHAGYERALGTIIDSNITTLIAGIALFIFGSGPVRGFAVVLCLGILTSMFSAVMVSRSMVNLIYGRKKKLASLSIG